MQSLGIYGRPRTNDKVIKAWQNGVSARNHRHSLTSISYPNGSAELFSYDLSREPCQVQDWQPGDHASEGVGMFTNEREQTFLR